MPYSKSEETIQHTTERRLNNTSNDLQQASNKTNGRNEVPVFVPQKNAPIDQRQSGSRFCRKAWITQSCLLLGIVVLFVFWASRQARAQKNPPKQDVIIALSNGDSIRGKLVSLDDKTVTVSDTSNTVLSTITTKITSVREIIVASPSINSTNPIIGLIDGSCFRVDNISTDDSKAFLSVGNENLKVPRDTLHWIAFKEPQPGSPDTDELEEIPENPAADIIAIKRDTTWQFIECVINQITPENVVVSTLMVYIPGQSEGNIKYCLHVQEKAGGRYGRPTADIPVRHRRVKSD